MCLRERERERERMGKKDLSLKAVATDEEVEVVVAGSSYSRGSCVVTYPLGHLMLTLPYKIFSVYICLTSVPWLRLLMLLYL